MVNSHVISTELILSMLILSILCMVAEAEQASCGWILWRKPSQLHVLENRQLKRTEGHWEILNAAENIPECQNLLKNDIDQISKENKRFIGLDSRSNIEGNAAFVNAEVSSKAVEIFREKRITEYTDFYSYLCLPGTADPRPR